MPSMPLLSQTPRRALAPAPPTRAPLRPVASTTARALLPFSVAPVLATAAPPTITCVTTNGKISCEDQDGAELRGERLEQLQQLLKPITEAPALTNAPTITAATPRAVARAVGQLSTGPLLTSVLSPGNSDPSISTLPSPDRVPSPSAVSKPSPGNSVPASSSGNIATPMASSGAFPGNVDPASAVSVSSRGNEASQSLRLGNDRGIVPGNVSPEMGDIQTALEAANKRAIQAMTFALIPGNIAPDGARGVNVEVTPVGTREGDKPSSLTLELIPGNVPPEVETMLGYLAQAEPRQISTATQAGRAPQVQAVLKVGAAPSSAR